MQILARAVGRRKEAVAQIQIISGTGQFLINNKSAEEYLQAASQKYNAVCSPFEILQANNFNEILGHGPGQSPNPDSSHLTSQDQGSGTDPDSGTIKTGSNNSSKIALNKIDMIVKVKGGGLSGQSDAIKLGIARAFCKLGNFETKKLESSENNLTNQANNLSLKKQLKIKGYLTQDSRIKERRKYGLKKARKASQYHKR